MTDTPNNILKRLGSTPFPDGLQQIVDDAADHIEAQAATIKALVEALDRMVQTMDAITGRDWCDRVSMDEVCAVEEEKINARNTLATAKETT